MGGVLIIADMNENELRDVSFELITIGNQIKETIGGDLIVGLPTNSEEHTESMNQKGVDTIYVLNEETKFNPYFYTQFVKQIYDNTEPQLIIIPHSATGIDFAPLISEELGLPLVTNVIDISLDGAVNVTRKMYNSKINATFEYDGGKAIITIGEHEWKPSRTEGDADIVNITPEWDENDTKSVNKGYIESEATDIDITKSDFIICIGRGIKDEENLEIVRELCKITGATLACTRPIVENGWLPWSRQVGKSGHFVSPRVYIAIGVSGAIEHLIGMRSSQTIIAINNDPDAPIFEVANFGIIGDLFEIIPELIEIID